MRSGFANPQDDRIAVIHNFKLPPSVERSLRFRRKVHHLKSLIKSTSFTARDSIPSDAEPTRDHEPAKPVYRYLILRPGALYQAIKVQLTAHPKMDLEFLKPYDLLVSLDSTDCSASICDLSTT